MSGARLFPSKKPDPEARPHEHAANFKQRTKVDPETDPVVELGVAAAETAAWVVEADEAVAEVDEEIRRTGEILPSFEERCATSRIGRSARRRIVEDEYPGDYFVRIDIAIGAYVAFMQRCNELREYFADYQRSAASGPVKPTNPAKDLSFRTFALALVVLWPHQLL
jgi:hypothetical protein